MNKRLRKKLSTIKTSKTNALIKVDLKNATDGKHVDVYVSNRFKSTKANDRKLYNENTGDLISVDKVSAKGKDYVLFIENVEDKKFSFGMQLSKTDRSYYIIRDKQI